MTADNDNITVSRAKAEAFLERFQIVMTERRADYVHPAYQAFIDEIEAKLHPKHERRAWDLICHKTTGELRVCDGMEVRPWRSPVPGMGMGEEQLDNPADWEFVCNLGDELYKCGRIAVFLAPDTVASYSDLASASGYAVDVQDACKAAQARRKERL